ncbi:hypothetical protein [Caballeronia cordobensis]|uniref:hypothetical protein n=1 Tax=Caballeronia cordobensis TaxID=1353886 RepID=UPI00045EF110|nr:hypothetical protein BRPE67_CCDS10910 [Burkholderia sp. RPE67]
MKVKAKRAMSYGNRHYASGDDIEMTERDAKLLAAVNRVSLQAEAPRKKPAPKAGKSRKTRGTYKRRDVRAEDSVEPEQAADADDADVKPEGK